MRLIIANLIAIFLAIGAYSNALSDAPSGESIQLRIRASIEVSGQHSTRNVILISTLSQDDIKHVDYDPYRMSLLVTDKRDDEFSMELTIFDQMEIARDSVTLLAGLNKEGRFEFLFDDVTISGAVWVEEIIQPRANME